MSTAFHTRAGGQKERVNCVVEEVMLACTAKDQSDWDKHVPLAEFAINSVKSDTGTTPFLMDYA
jgi:hypothetical protein